ncbi:hypothetical protein N8K70_10995 [Microbacterium betulae]|uniref:Uncharacterized protein n=1 Tax=Microbacterium betulae TaxID=2981139 RepID=A0AA97FGZ2_9MICO|nr:hypothetical protein [Microbacterium sp. AB]WOF21909.1 hypothetical protein N8K70_10995 [Microbacterium sp. AB]
MAGSTFAHCGDAWGFLGRALDSLLHGDVGGAVHLTYYAELRAALSLLAGEGIYVGNRTHFAISSIGVQPFGGSAGTHSVAWQALQAWTDSSRSQDLLGKIIRPGGEPFADWVDSLTAQAARAKIDDLFRLMSLDLRKFDQDHHRRNVVSYNPSRLHPKDMTAEQVRDLATDVWQALEPGRSGTFPVLDDALLPELLRSIYVSIRRKTSWSEWVAELAPASQQGTALLSALQASNSKTQATGLVGAIYESRVAEVNPALYLRPMVARTVLLLRVATGSAIQLVRESGHSSTALRPWLDSLALSRGYWSDESPLEDALDLWADVELAIEEAEVADVDSLHGLLRGLPTATRTFGQAERVPVWSFA